MNWHRLFGLVLKDFFTGSPFTVEVEMDLSFKSQFLDVAILRKEQGVFVGQLPDGFDDLTTHNLVTFKSHHEALDDWSLKELTGHYVNYRKQVSPSMQRLMPETEFHLYGVCARFPQALARDVGLEEIQEGVYICRRGTDRIRIIVTSQIPEREQNAIFHLFSATERVRFGASHYRQHSPDTSTLLQSLFDYYQVEGYPMPYTMEDFKREFYQRHKDELLAGLSTEDRLAGLSAAELLKRIPPEERLAGLPSEELLKRIPPEDRLAGISPEELRRLAAELERKEVEGEE